MCALPIYLLGIRPAMQRFLDLAEPDHRRRIERDGLIENPAHARLRRVLGQSNWVLLPRVSVAVEIDGLFHPGHVWWMLDRIVKRPADLVRLDVALLGLIHG